ncbi:hypothetical protein [Flaviaesturariibacter amylovorans]|uniref:TraB/GumN family protein n=1 Tax=Flaviaesturariibacter amylovorans TaxID=1084520 RepID=A0ABP8G5V5_9BACT
MRNQQLLLIFVVPLFLCSCVRYVAGRVGLTDEAPRLQSLPVEGKEVYFLGMMHLARPAFYANTQKVVEDLQAKGFVCYLESITGVDSNTRPAFDTTAFRKFRKLLKLQVGVQYSKNDNPIMQKMVKQLGLVDQPNYPLMGVQRYRWVDMSYSDLVRIYEFKHAPVLLDSCDLNTALDKPYSCSGAGSGRRSFLEEVMQYERNRFIAQTVLRSEDKKILILYGKAHYDGVLAELRLAATQAAAVRR